jgi:predicted metal-dependent phosphoesterase TrpH
MGIRCLFHVHTRHSFDSLLAPRTILARARRMQADLLIVTDHDSKRGSDDVATLAEGNPRFVLRAGEYKTEKGDLIGLFLKDEIASRTSNEVVREIHSQGGLVVLPHPFKAHKLDDELLSEVDLIETNNSRCSEAQNNSAAALALHLGKPVIGGCDAHCAGEIGAVVTEFACQPPDDEHSLRAVLLSAPRNIIARKVSRAYQPYSQLIKAWKTRNPLLFAYQLKQLAGVLAREAFSQ